jgi:acetyl-CoA C-acetyltransferase
MKEVFICDALRTPIGSFLGALSSIPAPKLAAELIKKIVERNKLNPQDINEVIIGNVLSAGIGQAPARQAALFGGLPESVECMTINKVCGSGLKAVMLAEQAIKCGDAFLILAGGMESMSNAPFLLKGIREGFKFGNQTLYDSMLYDGLIDVYSNLHMGSCSELVVKEKNISREEQDDFAIESYKRALTAQEKGLFNEEILPIQIKDNLVYEDEEPKKVKFEKIPSLKPVFEKDGTITAANASKLNDGAAMTLIADEETIKKFNLKPMVRIISQSAYAMNPQKFALAPIGAIKKSLVKANLNISDIDLFEINEAFSMVALAVIKELGIPHERVNVNGGAVALGHPIGASGARLLTTLIYEMKRRKVKYGLVSLCIGGGEAVSLIVENII